MIEFFLGLTQAVLGPIIADLVLGRTAAVRKREIETAIAAAARERRSLSEEQVQTIVDRTMAEVLEVVKSDPDLTYRFHRVSLTRPIRAESDAIQRELLSERLDRLQFLINGRRRALGLPVGSPEAPAQSTVPPPRQPAAEASSDTSLWEQVVPEDSHQVVVPELEKLKKRIRDRRDGGQRT